MVVRPSHRVDVKWFRQVGPIGWTEEHEVAASGIGTIAADTGGCTYFVRAETLPYLASAWSPRPGMNDRPERGLTPYGMVRDFAGRALDAMRTTRLGWAMNRSFPTVAVRTKQFVDYLLTLPRGHLLREAV